MFGVFGSAAEREAVKRSKPSSARQYRSMMVTVMEVRREVVSPLYDCQRGTRSQCRGPKVKVKGKK
jgi:hypothetical protein